MQRTKEIWFEEMQRNPQPVVYNSPLVEEVHMLCEAAGKTAEMLFAKKLIEKFKPYMNEQLMGWEIIQTIIYESNGNECTKTNE
jgi:hypothetical protein